MPKLCLRRLAVSSPFSWPIRQIGLAAETPEAADDRRILGELAVAGERREIVDQSLDVVVEMGPALNARDLRFLPRGQHGVELGESLGRFRFELGDLLVDRRGVALGCQSAQFVEARVDVGDWRFEAQVGAHKTLHGRPLGEARETGDKRPRSQGGAMALKIGRKGGIVARPERLELPTLGFEDRYSIQLSYGRERRPQ